MPKLTGGQALVASLYREGVRTIFGMPGVQLYHLMDALYEEPRIRFVMVRHEQAAAYMADGYSRAGGEGVGTAVVVPGPGLLNATAGIGTAYAASSPMLVVSGQIPRDMIGKDLGGLHEVNDQMDTIRPITKWAGRMPHTRDVPGVVQEAFRQLRSGRPRPVEIEIPWDTLSEVEDVELLDSAVVTPQAPDPARIAEAAEIVTGAERLLIWAGGGVISSGGSGALVKLAELLDAPVLTTGDGKGAISYRHPLSLGARPFTSRLHDPHIEQSDVILAVGTRLGRQELLGKGQRVVYIDVDPAELGRGPSGALKIVADARVALEALAVEVAKPSKRPGSRKDEIATVKAAMEAHLSEFSPQGDFVRAIRNALPDDAVLVEGVTQIGYASRGMMPSYLPRTYITSSYFGNLGFSFPTALGAKVARPDSPVVSISGDGGFLYNSQELATAVKHGINLIALVFNDNAYGNVYRDQLRNFEGRVIGSELHNPDFMKLADAYGARGVRADGPDGLERAIRDSIPVARPTLIEIPVGMMPYPFQNDGD